ncbi:MAG: Cyclolysin, partial [Pseudomonadota bacterium]
NVEGGTGGLAAAAGVDSETRMTLETRTTIGDRTTLEVTAQTTFETLPDALIDLTALNVYAIDDTAKMVTGGALAGAGVDARIIADSVETSVTTGASSVLTSPGRIVMSANGQGDLEAKAYAETYGAATVAVTTTRVDVRPYNTVTVGTNARLTAQGNVDLSAGTDTQFNRDDYRVYAYSDMVAGSVIPISDTDAYGTMKQTNLVEVDTDARVRSGGQINLHSERFGFVDGKAQVKSVSWTSALGGTQNVGGDFDTEGTTGTVSVNGTLETGLRREQAIRFTMNAAGDVVSSTVGDATWTLETRTKASTLTEQLRTAIAERERYASQPAYKAFWDGEVARITALMQNEGLTSDPVQESTIPVLTVTSTEDAAFVAAYQALLADIKTARDAAVAELLRVETNASDQLERVYRGMILWDGVALNDAEFELPTAGAVPTATASANADALLQIDAWNRANGALVSRVPMVTQSYLDRVDLKATEVLAAQLSLTEQTTLLRQGSAAQGVVASNVLWGTITLSGTSTIWNIANGGAYNASTANAPVYKSSPTLTTLNLSTQPQTPPAGATNTEKAVYEWYTRSGNASSLGSELSLLRQPLDGYQRSDGSGGSVSVKGNAGLWEDVVDAQKGGIDRVSITAASAATLARTGTAPKAMTTTLGGDAFERVELSWDRSGFQDGASESLMLVGSSTVTLSSLGALTSGSGTVTVGATTFAYSVASSGTVTTVAFTAQAGGSMTKSQADALIGAVQYRDTATSPSSLTRTFNWKVSKTLVDASTLSWTQSAFEADDSLLVSGASGSATFANLNGITASTGTFTLSSVGYSWALSVSGGVASLAVSRTDGAAMTPAQATTLQSAFRFKASDADAATALPAGLTWARSTRDLQTQAYSSMATTAGAITLNRTADANLIAFYDKRVEMETLVSAL